MFTINHPIEVNITNKCAKNLSDNGLDNYFRVARGRASVNESDCTCIQANGSLMLKVDYFIRAAI
jgi:hypothetical protein